MTDAIKNIFAKAHDTATTLVEIDGAIWLVYPSDPSYCPDPEACDEDCDCGTVTDCIYSADSWEATAGPEGEIDSDGDAAWIDSNGKPYQWSKIKRATTVAEARAYLKRWKAACKKVA